ncbi:hypothetical protein [Roseibium album]|uniref:hypothetical protein n=1 Tax=Roseibium album TaxID=311410 RepID=UPI0032980574
MRDEISFIDFDSYVEKEKYKIAAEIAFDIFRNDLQINRSNIIYKMVSIDKFFDNYRELPKPWLDNPYTTITGLKNGRTKEYRGRLLFFWLFLNHPDKCEPLAQHLWGCSSFAEHHKNQLLKKQSAGRVNLDSSDPSKVTPAVGILHRGESIALDHKVSSSEASAFPNLGSTASFSNQAAKLPYEHPPYVSKADLSADDVDEAVWLNPHNHYSIPLAGRKKKLDLLEEFVETPDPFLICALIAPSGAG